MIISRDTIITLDDNIKDPAKIILFLNTLFSTPVGTVALDREFGINIDFIDMPIPTAQAMLSAEVILKVAKYVPEVQASEVKFHMIDELNGEFRMEVKIKHV